jgi:thiosulfate reductase cytochrome b subunit
MSMFKNTLTFTITYSIVAAIVETRVEIVGLLLPTALIAVMAALMAQTHLTEIAERNADSPSVSTMARAASSAVSSLSQVAVQFTSNLVALGLSEVISNSRDTAWVLWFVLVAIGMLYAAAEVLNGHAKTE